MNVSENVENWNHDYILVILQILEELFNFDLPKIKDRWPC